MSKTGKPRKFDLAAIRQAEADKRGNTLDFEFGDREFSIPAPGFIPDETKQLATNDLAFAQALLGDDWDAFKAAGGRSDDIMLLLQAYAAAQGSSLGE